MTLKAGDVLLITVGTIHAAKKVASGTAKELATYVAGICSKRATLRRSVALIRPLGATASLLSSRRGRTHNVGSRAPWPRTHIPS